MDTSLPGKTQLMDRYARDIFCIPTTNFATFDFGAGLAGGEVCKLYWEIHTP